MNNKEKSPSELLKEKLFHTKREAFATLDDAEIKAADLYAEEYRNFLNIAKTEREAVNAAISLAHAKGFMPFDRKKALKAGDKVYLNNRGKALLLAVIGTRPITDGVSIAAALIMSLVAKSFALTVEG